MKVTYIVPSDLNSSAGIDGLIFKNSRWGTESKQQKIITNFNNNIMQVERRTDNGMAGSGRIYNINLVKNTEVSNKIIDLHPKSMNTYQDGIILPFPLPEFDLKSYLTSALVRYDFELNSEFPAESIKANFDRLLKKLGSGHYDLPLSKASCLIKVKVYPYRNGSKIIINAELSEMDAINNVIDVSKNISELKKSIKNVINS